MVDLEQGLFHDDPDFDRLVDELSQELLEIGTMNGKTWDLLRKRKAAAKHSRRGPQESILELVQANQLRFRQVKSDLERLQQWPDASAPQRYSQHKLATDFKDVFTEFQQIQQRAVADTRREINDRSAAGSKNDPRGIELEESHAISETQASPEPSASPFYEPTEAQAATQAFQEQLREEEISYQAGLVAEREEEIENVSRGMNELNEIFRNLSTIVTEQGTVLDNIESNIHSVAASTAAGAQQLTKAARWQRSSTGRSLCFLMILLILAIVVIISASIH